MSTDTWTWATADGLRLHARSWRPQGPAKAVIALLHGLGSHVQRHAAVAEVLCAAGYAVAGFDQRGFGRSRGRRGHTPSLQAYFDDIEAFLAQLHRRWPGLPQVLYGHSMGAVLALAFTLTRRPALAGVIATSAALRSRVAEQRNKLLLVRLLGRLLPTLSLDNGLDLSQLSRDPAVQAQVEADPLCHRRVTTAWGRAMLQAIALVEAQPSQFPVPLLLMHGRDDAIAYPCGSQRFAAATPAELVTLQLWEGFRHELHSDPEREQVFARMVAWLDRQVAAAGADRSRWALIGWSGC
jgi:alpha-beta hydrolase superfamily lysophospholipase